MPPGLEYHDHICISWKLNQALDFLCSDSPVVRFRYSELSLRLIKPADMLVMHIKSKPPLDGVYEIETFLSDKNSSKVNRQTKFLSFDSSHQGEIWRMDMKSIFSNVDPLVTNGMFNFVCIINFSACRCKEHRKTMNDSESRDCSLEKLSVDISKLYNSSEESDVSLKCGDQTLHAHRIILSARSEVFSAMFRNDMIECRDGVINISDIEYPILDHLLRYIYSGKLDAIPADTAVQLYAAADKYAVYSLKRKCASIMIDGLTEDNACEILGLAEFHYDQYLKNTVVSYLQKRDGFLLSTKWRAFSKMNPALAVEVYDAYVRYMSTHK